MNSAPPPQSSGDSEEQSRRHILEYFGWDARIRLLRRATTFGAPVFVVDFDRGARHFRTFGSVGPGDRITEQSSMDLMRPERLVFHYERLMSLAFAMVEQPKSALLLGLGGAAMWRFLDAHLPECTPTIVEADSSVVSMARRWFHLRHPVTLDLAENFLAANRTGFDTVLVDLYDATGPSEGSNKFWEPSLDALAPGGCLAVNWADFATNPEVRPKAALLAEKARQRGLSCFYVTRRGYLDNLIQYVPTAHGAGLETLIDRLADFARQRRLPDRGRGILENCVLAHDFPISPSLP